MGAQNPQAFIPFTISETFADVMRPGIFRIEPPEGVRLSSASVVVDPFTGPGLAVDPSIKVKADTLTVTLTGPDTVHTAGKINISGTVFVDDGYDINKIGTSIPFHLFDDDAGVSDGIVLVGEVVEPGVEATAADLDPFSHSTTKVIGIGSANQAVDTLILSEESTGSIQVPGDLGGGGIGTLTITAPKGVSIDSATASASGVGLGLVSNIGFIDDLGTTATFQVDSETSTGTGSISINLDAGVDNSVLPGTELEFILGGTTGVSGSAVLARVDTSTGASNSDLKDVSADPTAQKAGKISVVEHFPDALRGGIFRLVAPEGVSFAAEGHEVTGPVVGSPTVTSAQHSNDTLELVIAPTMGIDTITIEPNLFFTDDLQDQSLIPLQIVDGDSAGTPNSGTDVTADTVDIAFFGTSTPLTVGGNVDVNVGFIGSTPVEGQGTITASSSDNSIAIASVKDGLVQVEGISTGAATITIADERTFTGVTTVVTSGVQLNFVEKVATASGSSTGASFSVGASADGGDSIGDTFTASDDVMISSMINVDPDDVGKSGELYMAVKAVIDGKVSFNFVNSLGEMDKWDLTVAGLGAAEIAEPLKAHEIVLYSGGLQPGDYKIYVGYSVDGGDLIYTGKALPLTILPE